MKYTVPKALLNQTFLNLRLCGAGKQECQLLWLSPWGQPETITTLVHPIHNALGDGFELDQHWLNRFWLGLANEGMGIRIQIHTHPREAFHSKTDDDWPILHSTGFLSLVIPRFGRGQPSLSESFLAELQANGTWNQVSIADHLGVT